MYDVQQLIGFCTLRPQGNEDEDEDEDDVPAPPCNQERVPRPQLLEKDVKVVSGADCKKIFRWCASCKLQEQQRKHGPVLKGKTSFPRCASLRQNSPLPPSPSSFDLFRLYYKTGDTHFPINLEWAPPIPLLPIITMYTPTTYDS